MDPKLSLCVYPLTLLQSNNLHHQNIIELFNNTRIYEPNIFLCPQLMVDELWQTDPLPWTWVFQEVNHISLKAHAPVPIESAAVFFLIKLPLILCTVSVYPLCKEPCPNLLLSMKPATLSIGIGCELSKMNNSLLETTLRTLSMMSLEVGQSQQHVYVRKWHQRLDEIMVFFTDTVQE